LQEQKLLTGLQDSFIRSIAPAYVFEQKVEKGVIVKGSKKKVKPPKPTTFQKTLELLKEKIPLKDIAKHRDMTEATILNHVEKLLDEKAIGVKDVQYLKKGISTKKFDEILKSLKHFYLKNNDYKLGPVKNALGPSVSYRDIQLVRLFV
jgi:uncharacterized protein YpbB